jgi:hypothetical protein
MNFAHTALWARDLSGAASFWGAWFGATIGAPYHSRRRPGFVSRFASLPGGLQIELMTAHHGSRPAMRMNSRAGTRSRSPWAVVGQSTSSRRAAGSWAISKRCRARRAMFSTRLSFEHLMERASKSQARVISIKGDCRRNRLQGKVSRCGDELSRTARYEAALRCLCVAASGRPCGPGASRSLSIAARRRRG